MPFIVKSVEQGDLRGAAQGGVMSFLGVPYGASTANANRFRAPQPLEPWSGIRDALTFGDAAPQGDVRMPLLYPRGGNVLEGGTASEDCLRLNIWAPAAAETGELPVLVWFHGGGFMHGTGNETVFNGDIIASAGRMVVVTVTHRLGLLGFLDLREHGELDSANAGMLDAVAALEWVQRNISVFGGDPHRVTIAGQSGGSAKVSALNAMPRARALFARSIMMSCPLRYLATAEHSREIAGMVQEAAGVATAGDLKKMSVQKLINIQAAVMKRIRVAPSPNGGSAALSMAVLPGFGPSLDPAHFPEHPFAENATANLAEKQLLIGWTSHEASLFLSGDPGYTTAMSAKDVAERIERLAPGDGVTYASLAAEYPAEPPHLILARRLTQLMLVVPSLEILDLAAPTAKGTWVYNFVQPTEVMGGLFGATHSLDLAYAFGTVDRVPFTGRAPERIAASRAMMQAFAHFVHDGNPGWPDWLTNPIPHAIGVPQGPDLALPQDIDIAARVTDNITPALFTTRSRAGTS